MAAAGSPTYGTRWANGEDWDGSEGIKDRQKPAAPRSTGGSTSGTGRLPCAHSGHYVGRENVVPLPISALAQQSKVAASIPTCGTRLGQNMADGLRGIG